MYKIKFFISDEPTKEFICRLTYFDAKEKKLNCNFK